MTDTGPLMETYMAEALRLAGEAAAAGEVPVGAVVVVNGDVVGRGFNRPATTNDPTAHAEIVALRDAASRLGNYRLTGATMYVTVEPCLMCVGALVHARVGSLVYGAPEPKAGAVDSTQRAHEHAALNHRMTIISGVRASECKALMQQFFKNRRASTNAPE